MKVLITGSSGFVGSHVIAFLTEKGYECIRLVRRAVRSPNEVFWDPLTGEINLAGIEGLYAVVHLAGEGVATGRWSNNKKERIRLSRVHGTRALTEALARCVQRPRVMFAASAIGYYGDRGDELVTEESTPGRGFLADVCQEWEAASRPAKDAGIRVVLGRIGLVLGREGGALAKMYTPFKLGLGGRLGSGRQYMSWISIDDVVGAIYAAISTAGLAGPVNLVSPQPVTNSEFTRVLGRALRRPTPFPAPAVLLKLLLGEMAEELFLSSTRVKPTRLEQANYTFKHPDLESCLTAQLGGTS